MDKDRLIEAMASDALTEKPIEFSISVEEEVSATEERKIKKPFLFVFKRGTIEKTPVKKKETVERKFVITPPTLGKMQVLSKYYLLLELDEKALEEQPHIECMRVCESKTDIVCTLMAVATFDSKEDLLNDAKIKERADFFKWNTKPQDFATIILAVLTQVDYVNFTNSIRLTKLLRTNKPNNEDSESRVE